MARTTCKVPKQRSRSFTWAVLIGDDAGRVRYVESSGYPDDLMVRRELNLGSDVPILVGRP